MTTTSSFLIGATLTFSFAISASSSWIELSFSAGTSAA